MDRAEKDRIEEIGFQAAWGVGKYIALMICIGFVVTWVLTLTPVGNWTTPLDSTDKSNKHRSGVTLITDYGTGCQYLETNFGGITPRLNADGTQVCDDKGDPA